ncbi:MAG: 4Fe-4S binding protein [Chloroflexi bacterium]|nr:4Fe-4S binding protein [Chloroflexota bacterium]
MTIVTFYVSRFTDMASRFELTGIPLVKKILASRWLQWSLMVGTLPFFVLAVLTGLYGTPAGNRNFGIVFVWIVWWALLMLLFVPFLGRLWCLMCPIPAPGEWLQRRTFVGTRAGGKLYTLGKKWPKRLNNIWLQNAAFLAVALFSKVILTTPLISALLLLLFAVLAMVTSYLFERRIFCRYLCPVGGFIGLYSQLAPVELRVKDRAVCAAHTEKSCYHGNDEGYGCPWLVYPGALDKNTYCGLCVECLKTCSRDNIALYARPFGSDLLSSNGRRLDEAYRAFIMLAGAPVYSIVFMGPWSQLKEAAYSVGKPEWWLYALSFLVVTLGFVPGLFYACAALAKKLSHSHTPIRKLFVEYAYVLVPLGLTAWIAFSLSFVLMNISYAWAVVSDPFGWGWNLFGTTAWKWAPYLAGVIPYLQIPVLLIGLVAAVAVALRTAREQRMAQIAALPIVAYCVAFTMTMLWLNV